LIEKRDKAEARAQKIFPNTIAARDDMVIQI